MNNEKKKSGSKFGAMVKIALGALVTIISLIFMYMSWQSDEQMTWAIFGFYLIACWAGVSFTGKGIKRLRESE